MGPLLVSDAYTFVNGNGRKLYKMDYDGVKEDYETPNLSVLAEHITDSGITTMAFQRNPDEIWWGTRLDGTLLSMTYDVIQNVIAWARHPFYTGSELEGATESSGYSISPEYPTLQALTAAEIPTTPTAPVMTPGATAVTNATELEAMTGSTAYYLTQDIDLTGVTWTPITTFTGVFDGRGYTLSNLTISAAASDNQAMFGTCGDGAEIYDVTLKDFTITGKDNVGALIAQHTTAASLKVKNVDVINPTITCNVYGGGLIGYIAGVTDGGIYDCDITNPIITATAGFAGGAFGDVEAGTLTEDFNIVDVNSTGGTVTSVESSIGGFIGYVQGGSTAEAYEIAFYDCACSTAVISAPTASQIDGYGGFVAYSSIETSYTTCSATGSITITSNGSSDVQAVGGFCGFEDSGSGGAATVINCSATGNITIDANTEMDVTLVGGFIGKYDSTEYNSHLRCYATGDISVTNLDDTTTTLGAIGGFAGGVLMGAAEGADIQRCWATGDITLSSVDLADSNWKGGIGGFAGLVYLSQPLVSTAQILNCYAWGSITITTATTASSNDLRIGGFIGSISHASTHGGTVTITNVYSAQTNTATGSGLTSQLPSGTTFAGATYSQGSIGYVEDDTITLTMSTSYWDTDTSTISTDDYATGHVTTWMQTQSNYTSAGWDFDTIWYMPTPTYWINGIGCNSVAVIPSSGEDEVWVTVGRVINGSLTHYIERMKPRDWGSDMEDMVFLDSALTYDSTSTTSITGAGHLEGETVGMLADGAVIPTDTVASGGVTLTTAASVVQLGLPYTYKLKPMRLDQNTRKGTSKGSIKIAVEAVVSFYQTLNAKHSNGTTARSIPWRETDQTYTTPPDLYTGDKEIHVDCGYSVEDPFQIEGNDPMPCTVRAIIPRLDMTGR
jgi:hypothetical protein